MIKIVEHYTKPGEIILDPMAGSGTTMLACTLGRNVVLVELEEKFCKMCRDNWEQVRMRPQLGSTMGECQIIQGDARNLEGILADAIVSSPPYEATVSKGEGPNAIAIVRRIKDETARLGRNLTKAEKKAIVEKAKEEGYLSSYNQGDARQLEGLLVDKCIFSPPYTNRMDGGMRGSRAGMVPYTDESPDTWFTQRDQDNIGNLPYGQIDKIVTSPPYEEAHNKKIGGLTNTDRPDLIPYSWVKSENKDNIGNLKQDNYLSAMLVVYSQCYKVLKPQGLMIVVVKNFIRNQKEVDLKADTVKLCEQAGFGFIEEHHRILPSQSFWRTIYKQKYPDAPEINKEYVLVLRKKW